MNLSEEQKSLLIEFWRKDDFDWLYKIGLKVYQEIFHQAPVVKTLFPYVMKSERDKSAVEETKKFREQALKFIQITNLAVTCIETNDPPVETFDDNLLQLGRRHQKYIERGMKVEFWHVYKNAFIKVIQNECEAYYKSPVADSNKFQMIMIAWSIICDHIITTVMKGFEEECAPTFEKHSSFCCIL